MVAFEPLVQCGDLAAHRHAQLGVEVGQRLVEEEDARLAHDGAADRHALALAAGELRRTAVEQRVEAQKLRRRVDLALDLGTRRADVLESERHVLAHGHVRVQRVRLEHHGEPAIRGGHVVDPRAVDHDVAARDLLEPADHAQERGLAAAGRPDEDDELAIGDREVHAVDHARGVEFAS